MAANIGLNEGEVRASMKVLNNLLADHLVLLIKTWNRCSPERKAVQP